MPDDYHKHDTTGEKQKDAQISRKTYNLYKCSFTERILNFIS